MAEFETKREGALTMFQQSITYMLDAYRSEGMTKEQAQLKVLGDIAAVEAKFVEAKVLPEQKRKQTAISDPVKLVDEIRSAVQGFEPDVSKIAYRAVVNKLIHLKQILS